MRTVGIRWLTDRPLDLALAGALGGWLLGSAFGYWGSLPGRTILGLAALLFAPGYALSHLLYPGGKPRILRPEHGSDQNPGLSRLERLVLAIGLSLCVVPLIGIGLYYTLEISSTTYLGTIGGLTMLFTIIAWYRRSKTGHSDHHDTVGASSIVEIERPKPGSVQSVLIVGLMIVILGLGVAFLGVDPGEDFTEFYLTDSDSGTEAPFSSDSPSTIVEGEPSEVQLGIINNEGESVEYTILVSLDRLEPSDTIIQEEKLDTIQVTLDAGEEWHQSHDIVPTETGSDLRVTYELYRNQHPEDIDREIDEPYRETHYWVEVVPDEG